MYISAVSKKDKVFVWERDDNGRHLKQYSAEYKFFAKTRKPTKYYSMYGDYLDLHEYDSYFEFKNAVELCKRKNIQVFETDLPQEFRILSKHYYNAKIPNVNITMLDIEVDFDEKIGFSNVANPYGIINSVALYHKWANEIVVLAVPPEEYTGTLDVNKFKELLTNIEKFEAGVNIEIFFVKNEKELLLRLLNELSDSDVLTGWNSDLFDIPYIGKRIETVLGSRYLKKLCFDGAKEPRWKTIEINNRVEQYLILSGRVSLDYMELFKKYDPVERPSYKLEKVSEKELKNMRKLSYSGSLAGLYRKNFVWFIRYNIRDTEILKGFEEKLGYLALANQMCHMTTSAFEDAIGTIKLVGNAIVNFCHHEKNVRVNDITKITTDDSIEGAYVLTPKVGKHKNIGAIDLNSLYPSGIRSVNISPEKRIGQFEHGELAILEIIKGSESLLTFHNYITDERKTAPAHLWKKTLISKKYAISGYGTVYSQDEKGIVPTILENWFNTRKKHQKLKKDSSDKEFAAYHNRVQGVFKILLNSTYGAMSNKYFRFFNLSDAASVTATGRMILRHQCSKVNEYLAGEYALEGDAIIYGDTDSTYFRMKNVETVEEAIKLADETCNVVNASYPDFMKNTFLCTEGFDTIIKAGREIVATTGIFCAKKKYVLYVVDKEGERVNELKIMGLELKTTVIPEEIAKKSIEFITRLLLDEPWNDISIDIVAYKKELELTDEILLLGLPKGIKKNMEKYHLAMINKEKVTIPGHVAAAIHWNHMLKVNEDKISPELTTGMKLKVYYLKKPMTYPEIDGFAFKSIAIPVDIEYIPEWFDLQFFSNIDRHVQIEKLVDMPLEHIISAIDLKSPTAQDLVINSLIEF